MEFNQGPYSGLRGFLKNQGFYVVLVICLVIIGAAVAILTLPGDEQAAEQPAPIEEPAVSVSGSEDEQLTVIQTVPSDPTVVFALPTATPKPTATATPLPTATPKAKAASTVTKASPPVTGEVVWGYATEKLIYSKTLDQWTTHEGVDLSAAVGTQVSCVLAGTVEQVYEDDALGMTVIVAHSGDRVSLYANLSEDVPVKAGDKVNAGTVLGTVGQTAISECGEVPHLHFGFTVDGKPVDPSDHVRLG